MNINKSKVMFEVNVPLPFFSIQFSITFLGAFNGSERSACYALNFGA